MQTNAYSGDNQLIIWNKGVYVGAVHEGFTLPLQPPLCDEFPILPASFGNTYTARGVWNGIGDLFTSRIDCVDSSGPGFAARNLEHVARLMDLLKRVFVLRGWWRRYFRRAKVEGLFLTLYDHNAFCHLDCSFELGIPSLVLTRLAKVQQRILGWCHCSPRSLLATSGKRQPGGQFGKRLNQS